MTDLVIEKPATELHPVQKPAKAQSKAKAKPAKTTSVPKTSVKLDEKTLAFINAAGLKAEYVYGFAGNQPGIVREIMTPNGKMIEVAAVARVTAEGNAKLNGFKVRRDQLPELIAALICLSAND